MIINYPTYYNKFKCIADKCPDTCCAGWQVVIDEKTADFYKKLKGDFGEKLREKMVVDEDGDIVFVNEKGRCPFLNNCNLCDIYINVGEEHLSHTCTMFPRFYETFGGTREMGLSLSCPVANELILSDDTLEFDVDFNDEDPEFNDIDADLYLFLKTERDKLIKFAKSDLDMKTKLKILYSYGMWLRLLLKDNAFDSGKEFSWGFSDEELLIDNSVFQNLEYLTVKGNKLLTEEKEYKDNYSTHYIKLLVYFIYRYFLKSVYSGKSVEYLLFAIFSLKVISSLESKGLSLAEASRIYSKEIEHSADNLNSILEYLTL